MNDVDRLADLRAISLVMQHLFQVRQRAGILVDEDVPYIQLNGFDSLDIDSDTSLSNGIQHAKRRSEDFRASPFECVEPAAAESIDQRDA